MFGIEHIPGFVLLLIIYAQYVKVITENKPSVKCFIATSMFIYIMSLIGFILLTIISSIFLTST